MYYQFLFHNASKRLQEEERLKAHKNHTYVIIFVLIRKHPVITIMVALERRAPDDKQTWVKCLMFERPCFGTSIAAIGAHV